MLPSKASARRAMSGVALACEVASAWVLCAASLAALVTNSGGPDKRTIEATLGAPSRVSQQVRQEGTVVAVSGDSVTARSADGYTQTYRVTPNTTVISHTGGQTATAPGHFAVNDRVVIVGTIKDGAALATAVADGNLGDGDG